MPVRRDTAAWSGKEKEHLGGRGNLTTTLSKTTINKILQGILNSLKFKIVEEIGDRRFSVQMDSTQDTAAIVQETTVLRYVVGEEVKERLFSVQNVMDASASGIFQMLKGNFEGHGLKMENIVGESFDGASIKNLMRRLQSTV